MKCPFCNIKIDKNGICPACGTDAGLYYRTRSISNKLYNRGLSQAKAGDLTGAIVSFEQCITFDKVHYKARNLLGLTCYETGRVGDALMQWIISASLVRENNPAGKYIDSLQKNGRELEKWNDAVRMYNHAIVYLQQHSEDLAVIQLKKAVDLNPKFVEGYNLLTLCYLIEENYAKAGTCIDKVLELDGSNLKALYYAKLIHKAKPQKIKKVEERPIPIYHGPEKKRSVIGGSEVIAFFIGMICTAAVLITLVLPAWADEKDATILTLQEQLEKLSGGTEGSSVQNMPSYQELLNKNKQMEEELSGLKNQSTLQNKEEKIAQAAALHEEGDSQAAAMLLLEVGAADLPEEVLAQYNTVRESAYPKAAESLYTEAKSLFLNNDYENAQEKFENCLKFASGESFVDDVIYYLAKIAEGKGELEKAKGFYQQIINDFPESNQRENAQNSLQAVEEQMGL